MKSRFIRPVLAGTFAFFLLLLQCFPVVVMAASSRLPVPDLQAPGYQPPDLQAPDWDTPNLEPPQWETPMLESPQWDTPKLQAPNQGVPNLQAPNQGIPELDGPDWNIPDLQAPHFKNPNVQVPDLQVPDRNVEPHQPTDLSTDPKAPEPFSEKKEYDIMKLSIKDMMGGTMSYSADLIQQGEVDLRTGAGKYGFFLLQVGLKGVDIAAKDTPLGNVTSLTLDGLDGKAAYDSYRFVLQQNPLNTGANINTLGSFSNAANAANAANQVRVPGLVAGLNVGVAAISLPFDTYETFSKFGQAFDSSLSEDKQNEKFVDGVGALGSTLMDAGVIASVIPGGQTVAGVLVITGGILWGVSKLVKWSDKLSKGAVSRGIRDGIGKAVGWMKSIFSS
ncbi:hypothetical protein P9761_13320 [Brevibacillus centrosporus]|uniref:hypothetical protein n=1 Tax=Brevibacillus centrosporus TaxID=54910 RepID=UPI002E218035|nr:hypothetical protein [Brevibacillus centrosporus]